jgi:hypothetical protein
MDCCHSGTAMDLPYTINSTEDKMHANSKFDIGKLASPEAILCCTCLAFLFADDIIGVVTGLFED